MHNSNRSTKRSRIADATNDVRRPLLDIDADQTPDLLDENDLARGGGGELPLINEADLMAMIKRAEITPSAKASPALEADAGAAEDEAEEERPKSTKAVQIDFAQHLTDLKARTESEVPYCMTQCEDAMYLDQHQVVTLEFHYY
jgi:hypothetical protein